MCLFQIAGIVLIVFGAITYYAVDTNGQFDKVVKIVPILVMVIGSIIFVISFLGCCGAIKESTAMLMTVSKNFKIVFKNVSFLNIIKLYFFFGFQYGIILIIFFILLLCIGIYGLVSGKSELSKNELQATFDKYDTDPTSRNIFNGFQVAVSTLIEVFCYSLLTGIIAKI